MALKNPNNAGFTWCDAQNYPKSRIDYIFVKSDCIDHVKILLLDVYQVFIITKQDYKWS